MKKIALFVTLFSLVITSNGNAQDISFGAKAGLNISSLSSSGSTGFGSKPGFHVGGVAEIPFSDDILIQPEVLLSFQGSGDGLSGFSNDINLFYLNIPVAVKYNVWDELYVEAGPQLGVLLGNNLDDFLLDSNSIDIGAVVGAGYRLDDNFYFQLRFNAGFINAIEDVTSKNRVLQVSAIYFL